MKLSDELIEALNESKKLREQFHDMQNKVKAPRKTGLNSNNVKPLGLVRSVSVLDTTAQLKGRNTEETTYFNLLKKMKSHILVVLDPRQVSESNEDDIQELKGIFKIDSGRRIFANELCNFVQGKQVEVTGNSFDFILFLINFALNELNLNNGADFISGKLLLEVSLSIYRKGHKKKEFINDYIKAHPLWQNLDFWREYFWDIASTKYSLMLNESSNTKKVGHFLAKNLKKFSLTMKDSGGVDPESIKGLCEEIINDQQFDLDDSTKSALMQKLNNILNKE